MLPPAFQNHLAQLAAVGLQMHRMAVGLNLPGAMSAAREALALLSSEDLRSALPDRAEIETLHSQLSAADNLPDLRRAIGDLSRLIQSLGISNRPFLALVQNAPDQRAQSAEALQKTSVLGALERHWERGEHAQARRLLEGIVLSAREGNPKSRAHLAEIICSERPTVSINIRVLADVLESAHWNDLALQLIDPHRPLLIPGLHASKINPHLLSRILDRPPAVPEAVAAVTSMLRRRADKDLWSLRTRAAQGLFTLTTPGRQEVLSVFDYWKTLVETWPVAVPAIRPDWFGLMPSGDTRWDLYEDHLLKAFEIIENPKQPQKLREAALTAVWSGGPVRGPRTLCLAICSRTLDLAEKEPDWVWPIAESPLGDLARAGWVTSERLLAALPRSQTSVSDPHSPAAEPQRLLSEFSAFAEGKPLHLRLVSRKNPPLKDKLLRITTIAQGLGSYGLILEPGLVAAVLRKGLESLIFAVGSPYSLLSQATDDFRRALYALHPAAALTAWLDATGAAWPSHALPNGHRLEAALSLLRWLLDREKEPEELKIETAKRYWDIDSRFYGRAWRATTANPLEWWRNRLETELAATLARQSRDAQEKGAPHEWAAFARKRPEVMPEVMKDLRTLVHSPYAGTRLLAGQILTVLSR